MTDDPSRPAPRLDVANQSLEWPDRRVTLAPKAFAVLCCLLENAGAIVAKRALLDQVWADTYVGDAVLTVAINQLREALGDDAREPRYIETVHRRGYRWIGPSTGNLHPAAAAARETGERDPLDLVGRDVSLTTLEMAFARATAGHCQLAFITGEAGIGKSTLVDGFVSSVLQARGDVRIGRGQCVDTYGMDEPYMPVLEALERIVRGATEPNETLVDILRRFAPTWLVQMSGLISAAEVGELRRALASSSSARMVRELLRAGQALSEANPIILVLEDLHWADAATVSLLSAFAAQRDRTRLLILATLRREDATANRHPIAGLLADLSAKRQCIEVSLAGLDEVQIATYLGLRFGSHAFPSELAPVLRRHTDGNPLFLVHAVDDLIQRGCLTEVNGVWECATSPEAFGSVVPSGTHQMIEAQLERLPADHLELLEVASAIGSPFATQTLAAAAESNLGAIEDTCFIMARATPFLEGGGVTAWPDGSKGMEFSFRHALYQQVLAERIAPARGRTLHRRIADRIEAGHTGATLEVAARLAHHCEAAHEIARAVHYSREAARLALDRYAILDAIPQLRRALELLASLEPTPERRAEELSLLGTLIGCLSLFEEVRPQHDEIQQIADRVDELADSDRFTPEVFQAMVALMLCRAARAELPMAVDAAERIGHRGVELGPQAAPLVTAARIAHGMYEFLRGAPAAGLAAIDEAEAIPSLLPITPFEPSVALVADASLCECLLGFPARSGVRIRHALDRAAELGHPPTLGYVLATALRWSVVADDRELLRRATASLGEVSEVLHVGRWRGLTLIGEGWIRYTDGAGDAAEQIRNGRLYLSDLGYRLYRPLYALIEVRVLLSSGAADAAATLLDQAFGWVAESDEHWCDPELLRLRGECLSLRARSARAAEASRLRDAAADSLREAIAVAAAQHARWWERSAVASLLALLEGEGKKGELAALERRLRALDCDE